jgi:hypothetical protein
MKAAAAPVGAPLMWTLAYAHLEDRTPTHGYEPTREAAMAAFAESRYNRPAPALGVADGALTASNRLTIGKTRLGGLP